MKKLLFFFIFSVSIFAQSDVDFKYLQNVISKDSIVRADFIQTKQMKSLEKPLVCDGKILAVKNKGVVWILQNPAYLKKVITFNDNSTRSEYAMLAPFFSGDFSILQKRFDCELTKNQNDWLLKITPKSAAIKRNVKYITINSTLDNKFQEVFIFSADESFVRINFTSEIPTEQFLSQNEELLFEQE
ncbi:MAG: hypothetical protein FWF51_05690 [Chitinivibrionia bacterium]|nr:hypothetical protein [Chitinivibrionia bacterium]